MPYSNTDTDILQIQFLVWGKLDVRMNFPEFHKCTSDIFDSHLISIQFPHSNYLII